MGEEIKEKTAIITKLLFDEWDPIGVKDAGAPENHYKRYAREIVEEFELTANEWEIQIYLKKAFIRCLGEPEEDHSKSRAVAAKIHTILLI